MKQSNRYFLRRFRQFFLILFFPALIFFSMSLYMTNQSVDGEMRASSRQSVDSAAANLDMVLSSVFQQNEYMTGMARMSIALKRISRGSDLNYGDVIYMRSFQSILLSIVNSYEYIDSALLYLDNGNRYLSSDKSLQIMTPDSDPDWLTEYRAMPSDSRVHVVLRTEPESGDAVLTVFQRLLLQKGCIMIDLDLGLLEEMLDTFTAMPDELLCLLDSQGNILAQSQGPDEAASAVSEFAGQGGMAEELRNTESGALQGWENGSLICVKNQGDSGIYVASVTPRAAYHSEVGNKLSVFWIVLLLDVVIVAILSYTTTRHSFRHIKTLLKMFEDAEGGKAVKETEIRYGDEYDEIMNNIVRLFLNTSYLNTQLQEERYRQENAELMALQLQINPHFLFNTLQTLDIEAYRIDPAGDMHSIIRYISEILKYALEDPQKPVAMAEELEYLKKYMAVQKYRFGNHFIIYYEVSEDVLSASVFRMLLQPVLENSLLHGIRGLSDTGYIKVKIRRIGDRLQLQVIDGGVGMDKTELRQLYKRINDPKSLSIGLTNLNRRLLLRYGEESALQINSIKGRGTRVRFSIPFEK